uniref:progonadoliberin-1-like n=1 Tax=Doryrhamphus excisus TaxID=161450 RepID=UPI0025AE9F66|nr:progonadoliberin-1-like [Doryrhamphus excisus]
MKPWVLWLLLLEAIMQQSHSQHWSYGLNPGGKRGLNEYLNQQVNVADGFLKLGKPCSVLACGMLSTLAKMCRLKGFHLMADWAHSHPSSSTSTHPLFLIVLHACSQDK